MKEPTPSRPGPEQRHRQHQREPLSRGRLIRRKHASRDHGRRPEGEETSTSVVRRVDRDIVPARMACDRDGQPGRVDSGQRRRHRRESRSANTHVDLKGRDRRARAVYKGCGQTIITSARNQAPSLDPQRKSIQSPTRTDQTELLNQVVMRRGPDARLKARGPRSPTARLPHNQSDLRFLPHPPRLAGRNVWCVDYHGQRQSSPICRSAALRHVQRRPEADAICTGLAPRRLTRRRLINKVTVKGWTPETKELISGGRLWWQSPSSARRPRSRFGLCSKGTTCHRRHPLGRRGGQAWPRRSCRIRG